MTKIQKKWNWEAMAAIFVSLCALSVSILQEQSTQRHARLSVLPFVQTEVREMQDSTWELIINNKGVGPAMIKKIEYTFENKNYDERIDDLAIDIVGQNKLKNFAFGRYGGTVISVNESSMLVRMTGKYNTQKLSENYSKIKVKITFASIYEEVWVSENNVIKKLN